jgi:hypothetical protein
MTNTHTEPCEGLRAAQQQLARLETNEVRTHSWVKDLMDEVKELRVDLRETMISVANKAGLVAGALGLLTVLSIGISIYAALK